MDRRTFLVNGGLLSSGVLLRPSAAQAGAAATAIPTDVDPDSPLALAWQKSVSAVTIVDLDREAPELRLEAIRERHKIYCLLLMALIRRFWNGNNKGPVGEYPWRVKQKESGQSSQPPFRYRGDMSEHQDDFRVNWDRYLGHNIACLAVDADGAVVDFDFNHNNLLRSSTEHAEARIVRRLFSLSRVFDKTMEAEKIPSAARRLTLDDITIYTSLESCAQCSGIMSLGRVRQVIYLQHDPGAYRIGYIMFNLAARDSSAPPLPIAGSVIGLSQFDELDRDYRTFRLALIEARRRSTPDRAYFIPPDNGAPPDYDSSITSFLCTDRAFSIFDQGARVFATLQLRPESRGARHPANPNSLTNEECLDGARRFLKYADVEGFRGTPHRP